MNGRGIVHHVDKEKRNDDAHKSKYSQNARVFFQRLSPVAVQIQHEEKPSDQRPVFLDIPAPEIAPDLVCPNSTEEHATRHEREQCADTTVCRSLVFLAFLAIDEGKDHQYKRHRTKAICNHIYQHVGNKERGLQSRRIMGLGIGFHKRCACHHKSGCKRKHREIAATFAHVRQIQIERNKAKSQYDQHLENRNERNVTVVEIVINDRYCVSNGTADPTSVFRTNQDLLFML